MATAKINSVIVYGASGALGSAVVKKFCDLNWIVYAVTSNPKFDYASQNFKKVLIEKSKSFEEQAEQVEEKLNLNKGEETKVNAIICTAGGWSGGNASSKDFLSNTHAMIDQNLLQSVICARLAAKLLADANGLCVIVAAKAALQASPSMIGYGLAKAATIHLVKSLAAEDSGLPATATTLAMLPGVIDTPNNRKWMPNVDRSSWTTLDCMSDLITNWAVKCDERPKSGSLIVFDGPSHSVQV